MVVNEAIAITNIARHNGLPLNDQQTSLLGDYVALLREWNVRINLVSRRDEEHIWTAHILHSLSLLFHLGIPGSTRLLDMGSGGGLPGIPLAIARPDMTVVLLDSIAKKMRAVEDIIRRLNLGNASVICARAEDAARRPDCAGAFDCVVARAVGPLTDLIRWSRPLVRRRAGFKACIGDDRRQLDFPVLLCLKGGDLGGELRQASVKAGAKTMEIMDIVFRGGPVPGLEEKKIIVVPL